MLDLNHQHLTSNYPAHPSGPFFYRNLDTEVALRLYSGTLPEDLGLEVPPTDELLSLLPPVPEDQVTKWLGHWKAQNKKAHNASASAMWASLELCGQHSNMQRSGKQVLVNHLLAMLMLSSSSLPTTPN
jgi:hypothetical protein